jgi:CubicO group peptidase (beta-lactamase class C family)
MADVEHHTPVDADTVFRIGSITKQFTAAEILRLVAAGKLGLDDLLAKHLPDYPTHDRPITLRHLLTHTSGIAEYEHRSWLELHMGETRPAAELVASFAAAPFDFPLGTEWSYSNSGYFLLGQIIEKITGHTYAEEIEAMLAGAKLSGVRYCPDVQDYPHAAVGYLGTAPAKPIMMEYAFAAGAMCATATGLVGWARALSHGEIVDAAGWAAMTKPVTLADGDHYSYGFGEFVGTLGGHPMVFHNGGINGFSAKLSYYPDDDLYVAVLSNTETADTDTIDAAIGRAALGLPQPGPPEDLPIPAAELARAPGTYFVRMMGTAMVVAAKDGKLFLGNRGEGPRLLRQSDGSYAIDGASASIVFTTSGLEILQGGMRFPGKRSDAVPGK